MYTCSGGNEIYAGSTDLPSLEVKKVTDLLISWNLPQLCHKFEEEEISEDALRCLNAADIAELIPKVGPRSIFRSKLQKWKNQNPNKLDACLAGLIKDECDNREVDLESLKSVADEYSTNIMSTDDDEDAKSQEVLRVAQILGDCIAGQKALKFYQKNNFLDSHCRRLCVQTIATTAIERGVPMPPSSFNSIALQMVQLFPTEHLETYYVPRQGPSNPRGMLHHKYFNTCRRLRHQGVFKQRSPY